jgi:hypothetical protein
MTELAVTTAEPGELDLVLGILRSASAARASVATFTWGREFPDVERDLPRGLVHWLRLDCDQANRRLRGYYESLGFGHAGDVPQMPRSSRPGYRSAARYQRAVPG